ncbi:MAG TPA: DUF1097 domain-containing protein [Gemmatimonadaceae bacterium]|jgi:hypothetical protein
MSPLVALSVSIGILGGIATIICLKFGLLIWAAFIAWGCYFHSGGDSAALQKTIAGNILGAVLAWIGALIILSVPLGDKLGLPLWAGIVVGVTVFLICVAATIKTFSVIPANVYGYAAVFAFLLQTPGSMTKDKLLSGGLGNALIVVVISMILGAIFAIISQKFAATMTAKAP